MEDRGWRMEDGSSSHNIMGLSEDATPGGLNGSDQTTKSSPHYTLKTAVSYLLDLDRVAARSRREELRHPCLSNLGEELRGAGVGGHDELGGVQS